MKDPSSILEYVIAHLSITKGRWPTVAEQSGVKLRTLEKIARRESPDPRIKNIEKLYRHFREQEAGHRIAR